MCHVSNRWVTADGQWVVEVISLPVTGTRRMVCGCGSGSTASSRARSAGWRTWPGFRSAWPTFSLGYLQRSTRFAWPPSVPDSRRLEVIEVVGHGEAGRHPGGGEHLHPAGRR